MVTDLSFNEAREQDSDRESRDKTLMSEYDSTFDGEEKFMHQISNLNSDIDVSYEVIDIDSIVLSKFKKVSRNTTAIGLKGVVEQWGVVTPIHVMAMEDKDSYLLLEGLRRIFAAHSSGLKKIPAMVWNFSDIDEGLRMANVISLMINRSQIYTAAEQWELLQMLEKVNDASPGLIEYLLQMNQGDSMKLKDVMLASMEYSEIKDALMAGELTIEAAYKKLCAQRKKENRLAKEDEMQIGDGGNTDVSDDQRLSAEAVRELLEMDDDDDNKSLDELNESGYSEPEAELQNVNNRHPLDPKLRDDVLIRDDFKCRCCGKSFKNMLPAITVHHVVQVSQGGRDEIDNLITVCSNCHLLIHCYAWSKISVNEAELSEEEKKMYKMVFRYGNIIKKANTLCGKTKEQGRRDDKSHHLFPGEGLNDNKRALSRAQANASDDDEE